MRTNNLQVRNFPLEVNKALKKKALDLGVSMSQLVITILTDAVKRSKKEAQL